MTVDESSPFRIRFSRDGDLLRAGVVGESTLENTMAYWQAIVSEVRREPTRCLLLVDELRGAPLGEAQWQRLVEAMRGSGMEGVRIAHVKPQGLQKLEYCELYAREAGFDAHVFDEELAAKFWLRYGDRRGVEWVASGLGMAPAAGETANRGFEIDFRQEADSVVADVTGWIDDVESLIGLFQRCTAQLRRSRSRKLLVLDHSRGVVPPEAELRRLISALEGSGFEAVRVAYVDVRGTAVGRIEVAEILGRERGYQCRVFDNPQRARIWLDYGEP
jgi:hypothetical protein